jgi:hypothetical protein
VVTVVLFSFFSAMSGGEDHVGFDENATAGVPLAA